MPWRVTKSRGAWRDNVFVERLWRSVKYEEVLRAYDSVSEARASIGNLHLLGKFGGADLSHDRNGVNIGRRSTCF